MSVVLAGLATLPVVAQEPESNYGQFTLDAQKRAVVTGMTGGSTSLPAITANSDRWGHPCLGFADPQPDHVMQLDQPVQQLTLQVNSNDNETTLVIVGPNGDVRCNDDAAPGTKDAGFSAADWPAGIYQIWVGGMVPGARHNYRLLIQAD
jgi:hypothetical protein